MKSAWIYRPGSIIGNRDDPVYTWKFDELADMADAVDAECTQDKRAARKRGASGFSSTSISEEQDNLPSRDGRDGCFPPSLKPPPSGSTDETA